MCENASVRATLFSNAKGARMLLQLIPARFIRSLSKAFLLSSLGLNAIHAQVSTAHSTTNACHIEPVDYKGWQAQQLSNKWVQLIVVPQNGGRLMQVTFAGHAYLFVNPKYS